MEKPNFSKSESNIVYNHRQNLSTLPRLVTSIIFRNLNFDEKLMLRESCPGIRCHIDDHIRREFIKWKRSLPRVEKLSHDEILLLSIEQFTNQSFNPPCVITLIEKTRKVASSSDSFWRDLEMPRKLEDKQSLLKVFYEAAGKSFDEKELKTTFTLTLLNILRALSGGKFTVVHPSNRGGCLRLQFNFQDLFLAIPFYNYVFDWFSFERDWVELLLLFVKFLEIKVAVAKHEDVKWVNFPSPTNFPNASVIFARRNPFNSRVRKPSRVKCVVWINSNCDTIKALEDFLETGELDWLKVSNNFSVICELSCLRVKVCEFNQLNKTFTALIPSTSVGCRSSFSIKYHHSQSEESSATE